MTTSYLTHLSRLTDDQLLTETETQVWLSTQPATVLSAECHAKRAACAQECARRNGNLYSQASAQAARGWPRMDEMGGL